MQQAEQIVRPDIPAKEELLNCIEIMDDYQIRLVLSFIKTLFQD